MAIPEVKVAVIRSARPDDCAVLADLILLSDSGLFPVLFPGGPRTTLTYLASRPRNPFSYQHALVVELRRRVVAAAVGSIVRRMTEERLSTLLLITKYYGLRVPARLQSLARAGSATKGLDENDYYLNNIAVLPRIQGRGYGTKLIRYLERELVASGVKRVVLDVDPGNEPAMNFYASLGYREERSITISLPDRHCFEYRRMWKPLTAPS